MTPLAALRGWQRMQQLPFGSRALQHLNSRPLPSLQRKKPQLCSALATALQSGNDTSNLVEFLSQREHQTSSQDRITSDGRLITGRVNPAQAASWQRPPHVPLTAPAVPPISEQDLERLADFVHSSNSITVLTGAGVSTESNIPDYRGASGAYATGFKPMTHQQFMGSPEARSRYWARSFAGWREFSGVQPNEAHFSLTRLQRLGWVGPIITQNVDRLHHQSGSQDVMELHGTTHRVICMSCREVTEREPFQAQLAALNPAMAAYVSCLPEDAARTGQLDRDIPETRPDGDVELPDGLPRRPDGDVELQVGVRNFRVPPCGNCGGILKPNVVYFGDGIPKHRAHRALELVTGSDRLLVVGSSLMVYSAFRLAKAAKEAGARIAAVSVGATRADDILDLKIEALAGETMARLASHPCLLLPRSY